MFKFKVKGQHLAVIEKPMTVSDTIKYLSASFEFSEDWDGLDKWAHFKKGETTYDINLVNDAIPASAGLNLASGSYKVYLHGSKYTGETTVQRITTSAVIITVQQADVLNGQPLPTVPPSATEQILAKVSNASNKADAAALSASSAQASATSAQTSAAAAAASASGKYTKPSSGIPKTDLASAVQNSLGKADSALQEHQSLSAYRTSADQDEIDNGLAENINSLVDTKYEVPQGGIPSTDMTEAVQTSLGKADTALQEHQSLSAYRTSAEQDLLDAEKVSDIKINGTSIVSDGVGNIPMATQTEAGVFKPYNGNSSYGLSVDANRGVLINKAVDGDINSRVNGYKPIVPSNLDYAVKSAMCDGRGADWSESEQKACRKRIGEDKYELIEEVTLDADAIFSRSVEPDGTAYNFKKMKVEIRFPIAATQVMSYWAVNGRSFSWLTSVAGFSISTTQTNHAFVDIDIVNGFIHAIGGVSNSYNAMPTLVGNGYNSRQNPCSSITAFHSYGVIPTGTTIKIYAIRA